MPCPEDQKIICSPSNPLRRLFLRPWSRVTSRQLFITSSLLHVEHDPRKLTVNNETKALEEENLPLGEDDFRIKALEKSISSSIYPYLLIALKACRSHLFSLFAVSPFVDNNSERKIISKRNHSENRKKKHGGERADLTVHHKDWI